MCSPLRADELDLVRQAGLDGGSDALTAFLLKHLKKMNKKKKKRKGSISEIPRPGHSLLPHTSAVSHTRVSKRLSEALTCSPPRPPESSAADSSLKSSATEWLSKHRWDPVLLPLPIFCLLTFPPMHNNSAAENWLSIP